MGVALYVGLVGWLAAMLAVSLRPVRKIACPIGRHRSGQNGTHAASPVGEQALRRGGHRRVARPVRTATADPVGAGGLNDSARSETPTSMRADRAAHR